MSSSAHRGRRPSATLFGRILLTGAIGLAPVLLHAEDPTPPSGDAASGAGVYKRYCRGCHGVDGQGDGLVFMPHVNNLTKKGYIEQLPDRYLRHVILNGGESVGKSAYMPSFTGTLSEQQIADVIAHVRSLPTY
jgi:cytochrome c oxidase cbb3-type subunit III